MDQMGQGQASPERLDPDQEPHFPNLSRTGYAVKSCKSYRYNCIAFASGDERRKWDPFILQPGYFWPDDALRGLAFECLISVFQVQHYELCQTGDLDESYEKVALYSDDEGDWAHAAKQLPDGSWLSKLGNLQDIKHPTPEAVNGPDCGRVKCYMRRRKPNAA